MFVFVHIYLIHRRFFFIYIVNGIILIEIQWMNAQAHYAWLKHYRSISCFAICFFMCGVCAVAVAFILYLLDLLFC